jgi:hypothetical protein
MEHERIFIWAQHPEGLSCALPPGRARFSCSGAVLGRQVLFPLGPLTRYY